MLPETVVQWGVLVFWGKGNRAVEMHMILGGTGDDTVGVSFGRVAKNAAAVVL